MNDDPRLGRPDITIVPPGREEIPHAACVTPQPPAERRLESTSTPVWRREVRCGDRVFLLRRDLLVDTSIEDGLWCYECPELHLGGCSQSFEEADQRLGREFAFLWDDIACERDEALHAGGQHVKRLLLDLVLEAR